MYHSYPSILLYKIENSHTDFTESFLICLGTKKTVTSETGNEYSERDNKEWKSEGEKNEREHR